MKYLLLLLLLTGCTQNPGQFEGKVIRGLYSDMDRDNNRLEIYSKEYGFMNVYDSPYFDKVRIGQRVNVACEYMKGLFGGPYECHILGPIDESQNNK